MINSMSNQNKYLGVLHRMREHSIIGTLDPFIISTMNPRSLISVVIQEVSDDGSVCFLFLSLVMGFEISS